MPLNPSDGISTPPDDIGVTDTPPHIDYPENWTRVGIGLLTVVGGGHARRRVRIASVGMEDALSDEFLMDGAGHYKLTFREPMKIGRKEFQVILWPPYPALRSRVCTVFHVPAPKIKSPPNDSWLTGSKVRFTGANAAPLSIARVFLGPSPYEKKIGEGNVDSNGAWSVEADLATYEPPSGFLKFYVDYTRSDLPASDRAPLSIRFLSAPTITSPHDGDLVSERRPVVSGTGYLMLTVSLYEKGGSDSYGEGVVGSDDRWSIELTRDLPCRPISLVAIQSFRDVISQSSEPVQLTYFGIPAITCPAEDSTQHLPVSVKGSGSTKGARVEVFKDLNNEKPLGWALSSEDEWTVHIASLDPGPVSLVAKQVLNGIHSDRSAACAFRIAPPKLATITVEYPTSTTAKFSGTGYSSATVQITILSGSAAQPAPVVVRDGKWETAPVNWPFGSYCLSAVQKVSDNAGGWIESEPFEFPVDYVFPIPGDIIHTKVYTPTFSGKGVVGAIVSFFNADRVTPVAPDATVNNNDRWSSTVFEQWGPVLRRDVHIRQRLPDHVSNWVICEVKIPPLVPVVESLIENGLSPQISGTCWPGAVVTLEYNKDGVKHKPTVTNGNWTFRRGTPFAPGVAHTFTVFQTAASQDSPSATGSFTVRQPMLKPEIIVPADGAEVSRRTTVSGKNGMKGALMQVRDAQMGGVLNDEILTRDGDWSIELKNLEYRRYYLDAMQTFDTIDSEPSEPRSCHVVLEPPILLFPVEGGDLPRQSRLTGTGWPNARVTVWLEGRDEPLLLNLLVNGDGTWHGQVSLDQVGSQTLRVQQAFENQESKLLLQACRVVPSVPFIESPVRDAAIGSSVVISGFGYPGDTVTVALSQGTELGTSRVLEDRTWSVSAYIDHPGGSGGLVAAASREGFESAPSVMHPLQLNTWLPTIDEPSPGRWVDDPVTFAGRGKAGVGQSVSWFNPDVVWAANLPVSDGQWQGGSSQPLPPGGNWCRFRQSFEAGADPASASDWAESQRFEVLPLPRSI